MSEEKAQDFLQFRLKTLNRVSLSEGLIISGLDSKQHF